MVTPLRVRREHCLPVISKIIIIQEIQDLFREFNISFKLSEKTNSLLSSYNRELELFDEFSNNAVKISKQNSWEDYVDKLDTMVEQYRKDKI